MTKASCVNRAVVSVRIRYTPRTPLPYLRMPGTPPQTIYLKDYVQPEFAISTVDLDIALYSDHSQVRARLAVTRKSAH
ncbi:MAG: hypothetical protein ACKVQA_12535, partial [Burkholderiales bacterium]